MSKEGKVSFEEGWNCWYELPGGEANDTYQIGPEGTALTTPSGLEEEHEEDEGKGRGQAETNHHCLYNFFCLESEIESKKTDE